MISNTRALNTKEILCAMLGGVDMKNVVFPQKRTSLMDKIASTRVVQMIIKKTDYFLKMLEDTAKWGLPQDDNDEKLERPLPWLLFIPLIVGLRISCFWLSIGSYIMYAQPVTASTIMIFLKNKRLQLKAISERGLKYVVNSELAELSVMCQSIKNRDTSARCSVFVPKNDKDAIKEKSEHSLQRPSGANSYPLPVAEMIQTYSNQDSDDDPDYVPDCGAEDIDSTTDSFTSTEYEASDKSPEKSFKTTIAAKETTKVHVVNEQIVESKPESKSANAEDKKEMQKSKEMKSKPELESVYAEDKKEMQKSKEMKSKPESESVYAEYKKEMQKSKEMELRPESDSVNGKDYKGMHTSKEMESEPESRNDEDNKEMPSSKEMESKPEPESRNDEDNKEMPPSKEMESKPEPEPRNDEENKEMPPSKEMESKPEPESRNDEDNKEMPSSKEMPAKENGSAEPEEKSSENRESNLTQPEAAPRQECSSPESNLSKHLSVPLTEKDQQKSTPGHETAASMKPPLLINTNTVNANVEENCYRTITTQTSLEVDWSITIKTEITHHKTRPKLENLNYSVQLTPATSDEDIFYSPVESPDDVHDFFHPASIKSPPKKAIRLTPQGDEEPESPTSETGTTPEQNKANKNRPKFHNPYGRNRNRNFRR